MFYLADTNVISRRILPNDPHHAQVKQAITRIKRDGGTVYITPQVMIEFRAVATRPLDSNGFGMTAESADAQALRIARIFPMLPDRDGIYQEWVKLVRTYKIIGLRVYDARLVAVMMVHNISNILTLNPKDYRPFAGIKVIQPGEVLAP